MKPRYNRPRFRSTVPTCSEEGCDRKAVARGRCATCYSQLRTRLINEGKWKPCKPGHGTDSQSILPERKPWEYENPEGEAELIARQEQNS